MSVMGAGNPAPPDAAQAPRVREMARAALLQMTFSALVSVGLVAILLVVAHGTGR